MRLVEKFEQKADSYTEKISTPYVTFLIVLLLCLTATLRTLEADPDLFARVAVGKLFIEQGFQTQDPFSFSPKKPVWVDHEWLAGVVFFSASQLGGDLGLLLLKFLFISAILIFIFRACRLQTTAPTTLIITSFTGLQCTYLWATTIRSQLFTYLFLAYLLWAIVRFYRFESLKPFLAFPLCMLIWIQAHGGFVVGLGFFGLFCCWAFYFYPQKRLALCALAFTVCASALITPYGAYTYWSYILTAITMPRPTITEWYPIDPFSIFASGLYLISVLALYGFIQSKSKRNKTDILTITLILLAAYFGLKHQRLAGILFFVLATVGAGYLEYGVQNLRHHRLFIPVQRALTIALLCIVPLCAAVIGVKLTLFRGLDYREYPVLPMLWLDLNAPPGKLLVDFNNGSYALWRGYPNFTVSVDGRYEELYPDKTMELVTTALRPEAKNHSEALKRLNPDYILVDLRSHPKKQPDFGSDWQIVFNDSRHLLLTRSTVPEKQHIPTDTVATKGMWERPEWSP